jgi:hypothetical protein
VCLAPFLTAYFLARGKPLSIRRIQLRTLLVHADVSVVCASSTVLDISVYARERGERAAARDLLLKAAAHAYA